MTKEQEIRVKIVPQLERVVDDIFDESVSPMTGARKLYKIIDELTSILNEESNDY